MKLITIVLSLLLSSALFAQADSLIYQESFDLYDSITQDMDSLEQATYVHLKSIEAYEIAYMSDGHRVSGYMLSPQSPGPHSIIIFNRGGNRDFASLSPYTMANYCGVLASEGYLILASNYRDADEFGGAELNDVLKLIDIAPSIAGADTSRIGMLGWSRGGMMAYMAMARTTRLKAVAIGNGPSDLSQVLEDRPGLEANVLAECIPDYFANKEEELRKRSVVHWIDELDADCSLLLLAGSADNHVDVSHAKRMAELLSDTEMDYTLKVYDTDHFFGGMKAIMHEELLEFFEAKLR